MKLSKRLSAIFKMFSGDVAADVGSDHGKLIISLFLEGKIKKGYAIEKKKGPFTRLKQEIDNYSLSNDVIPMFSDGISDLKEDVDSVIIAGMGGHLIVKILKAHPDKLKNVTNIYIDAHNGLEEVRREITKLGYKIVKEQMVYEDDIYYELIAFRKGNSGDMSDIEYKYGPLLIKEKSDLYINKHLSRIKEIDNLLNNKSLPEDRRQTLIEEELELGKIL